MRSATASAASLLSAGYATSVGTRIVGSTSLMSVSNCIRVNAAAPLGLTAARCIQTNQSKRSGSWL